MGMFGKKKKKTDQVFAKTTKSQPQLVVANTDSSSSPANNNLNSKTTKQEKKLTQQNSIPDEPTMEHLPDLILDLESPVETSADRPARALRMLFALSEHGHTDNRTEMVTAENGRLVSALLTFLTRCARKSSEQYLTLLVLNNVSIPSENKRIIALDHAGADVFAKLLCEDPSCHLMAIILVNLTFAEADLRKELVSEQSGIGLIESLSFALRVASLTRDEFQARQPVIEESLQADTSPAHRLALLMAEDQRLRPVKTHVAFSPGKIQNVETIDPSRQMYSETARWCLSALTNLTRPSKDATAAHILIKSGIFSLILRYITVSGGCDSTESRNSGDQSSSSESPIPADPLDDFTNAPSSWDSNSMQDAALLIVLNLSACSSSRDYIYEDDAVNILSAITEFQNVKLDDKRELPMDLKCQQDFQCLKARMALAYLVGSQGHYGQAKITSSASTVYANLPDSVLMMTKTEIELLVELLANTMQQRGKDGSGGYSAATFSFKYVLFALRCLLTHSLNQTQMADVAGRKLNTLLMKALAQHSIQRASALDAESAEHACFTLYLQSNYGFKQPFLPASFKRDDDEDDQDSLSAKVFTSYLQMPSITPAGIHAAEQILLRHSYLIFSGEIKELAGHDESTPSVLDLTFEKEVLLKAEQIHVGKRIHGANPTDHIFDRPILRSRIPSKEIGRASWDNRASLSAFPSALQAVQQLSYGSVKVWHIDPIDDILIANNILNSADGETTESYNFMWSWEDKASEIQRNLERQRSTETTAASIFSGVSNRLRSNSNEGEPIAIFGLRCAPLCSTDTSA